MKGGVFYERKRREWSMRGGERVHGLLERRGVVYEG